MRRKSQCLKKTIKVIREKYCNDILQRVTTVGTNYRKKEPLKKAQKQQNCKCCRLGLIEPVHGQ